MKLYSINTGHFKLDGGAMFGVVPKSIWNKTNPADANNMISLAMRALLIEDGKKLILIDNGMGTKQDAKFFSYYFMHGDDTLEKSLGKHGFTPDDITDVFLSHLHFDHCGGSVKWKHPRSPSKGETRSGYSKNDFELTFKNATYWSNEQHWEWATNPNKREKASFLQENIQPIKDSGHLKFIAPPQPSPLGRETEPDYFTSDSTLYPLLKSRSEEFRNKPTQAEMIAWELLRENKTGFHIRRQHIIGRFIVDFVNIKTKTVIEIDGDIHDYQQNEDAERTQFLNSHGFEVIRFRNENVSVDPDNFLLQVKNKLSERMQIIDSKQFSSVSLPNGEGQDGATSPLGYTSFPNGEGQDGASILFSHGHTDAMMHPHIKYKDKTIVYMADLLPTVGHIPLPYIMGYDTRPLITLDEKEKFMNKAAEEQYVLFLEHDPTNECCTVEKTEKGVRLKEAFKLTDYSS